MKEGLKDINDLTGTWGSLVCDNQGGIIEGAMPPGMNKASQENITRHLLDLFRTAGDSVEGMAEVVLHYDERKVFALDLEKAFLVVFCTPGADIPLLRMTVNLVLASWEEDPEVQKILQDNLVDRN